MSSDELLGDEPHDSDTGPSPGTFTRDELLAELELLREQNRRLQDSYVEARRTRYHRTAVGLTLVGLVAVGGAVLFAGVRDVLLVLGATGLFGALLTYYLTPERFISATVGTAVYDAVAADRAATVEELGLTDTRVYVPVGERTTRVRLFVPQYDDYTVPADEELASTFVVPPAERDRGIAFRPTGDPLFHSFEEVLSGPLGDTPATLATQVTDALVEQLELVTQARVDLDAENGRLTVDVTDSVYGSVDRIDHPVASFVAVGLAKGLDRPVAVETQGVDSDRADYRVTCRWPTEDGGDDED